MTSAAQSRLSGSSVDHSHERHPPRPARAGPSSQSSTARSAGSSRTSTGGSSSNNNSTRPPANRSIHPLTAQSEGPILPLTRDDKLAQPRLFPGEVTSALCRVGNSQRPLQFCIGVFHEPVDSLDVLFILLEDRVGVSDCVSHPRVVREQHRSSIGWIVPGRSFEGDEAIADLVAVHPRPKAQFIVSADAWFADFRERVLPSSEQLVVLSTNEVWPDVHVVDEAELVATPDALCLRGIRVE